MALGNSRPRNWGVDAQNAALGILLLRRNAAYKVVSHKCGVVDLMVAPSKGNVTLPFETIATLGHLGREKWESYSPITGELIAAARSKCDLIRKTIEIRWN